MKVVFLQNTALEHFGVEYMSAMLKRAGHQCEVLMDPIDKIVEEVVKMKPDLLAFSCATSEIQWVLTKIKEIKAAGINSTVLVGGPHPTYHHPVLKEDGIDIICIGEGDEAIVELADKLEKGEDIRHIKDLHIKDKDGKIWVNPVRPLKEDLDEFPFPDRSIYFDKYPFLRNVSVKRFMSGRGCPYNCTFCFNHSLVKVYRGKGKYVRRRSPQNFVREIKEVMAKYGGRTISFSDDTFVLDEKWLYEFLDLYKKEVNIPFVCTIRGDLVTEEMARRLKEANCLTGCMGVETGNDVIRNKLLRKGASNEQIINAAKWIKDQGIYLKTFNITGLPGETLENLYETAELNRKIKSDMPSGTFFIPFPGLELTHYSQDEGYLDKSFDFNNAISENKWSSTSLDLKHKYEAENMPAFLFLWAKFPILIPLIKLLIKMPPNRLFKTVTNAIYALRTIKLFNLGYRETLFFAIKSRFRLQ